MEDKDVAKRMMSLLENTDKQKTKDLRSALLSRMNRTHHQNINVEFFECIEDVRQIKADLMIHMENNGKQSVTEDITSDKTGKKDDSNKTPEEKLIASITTMLDGALDTPRPKIDSTGKKYQFREGSESRFEDYEQVKTTVREDILFNKIMKLNNLFSQGLGLLGVKEKSLWQINDMVEEINPEDMERDNGRGTTGTDTIKS